MNVFVLSTGRCGSTTFIRACQHIVNFTAAHESRARLLGPQRFQYPPRHIEADNRLSWVLGRLEQAFGDAAMYVHLKRDDAATAASFATRYHFGIIRAYRDDVLMGWRRLSDPMAVCLDYCNTVNANIELFLRHKTHAMRFSLEAAKKDFADFWTVIGAEGDLEAALAEWDVRHNAS